MKIFKFYSNLKIKQKQILKTKVIEVKNRQDMHVNVNTELL